MPNSYERAQLKRELLRLARTLGVKCERCKRNMVESVLHHKDKDRDNNKLENLMILCEDCHRAIHKAMRKDTLKTNGNPFYRRKEVNV